MISLRWLQEFADLPDDGEAVAQALSGLGHEVEGMRRLEAPFSGVVVARVLEVRPHPRADKLRLARLDTGSGEQEVVCGAWNFEAGDVVPLSTVGAVLAGGLKVGEREIRGVLSRGMICSEAELGLAEESSGILVLGEGYPVGADFAACLPVPGRALRGDHHLEPARRHVDLRPGPGPGGALRGAAAPPGRRGRAHRRPHHRAGRGGGPGAVPALHRARDPRAHHRPLAAVAAAAPAPCRGAPHQQRGGRHQLRDAGAGPADPRLRPGPHPRARPWWCGGPLRGRR